MIVINPKFWIPGVGCRTEGRSASGGHSPGMTHTNMIIIDYKKKYHQKIITACVAALKAGKLVAYPTDTSYGLAADAGNFRAIKNLYRLKGRNFDKPIHVVVPSVAYAKKIVQWNSTATKLTKKFWPGPLTLAIGMRVKGSGYKLLTANNWWLGVRMPKNKIALDLAKNLGRPITTTSANISGKKDCYSGKDVVDQFRNKKLKPDIIINAGKLPKRKPSTVVRIDPGKGYFIYRQGPITEKQILKNV